MQLNSRGPSRQLVSPLPSPALSSTESSFSISKYAHGPASNKAGPPSHQVPPHRVPVAAAPLDGGDRPAVFDTAAGPARPGGSHGVVASPEPDGSMASERIVRAHWESFRLFLGDDVEQDHARQNRARDKLTRLSRTQFQELSTDLYDEVQRRTRETAAGQAALPPNPAFHPRRNQAREKLASLQTSRFKDLTSDVFCEIERRYPRIPAGRNDQTWAPPRSSSPRQANGDGPAQPEPSKNTQQPNAQRQPNAYRQTAVIPNKSTMIEEDVESDYDYDLKSNKPDADHLTGHSSDYEVTSILKQVSSPNVGSSRSVADSDARVNELLAKVNTLETELKRQSEGQSAARQTKRDVQDLLEQNDKLEQELQTLRVGKVDGAVALTSNLQLENDRLKAQLLEQQRLTEEVRSEAESFLNEMRALSDRETEVYERSESLQVQVNDLEIEVREWKDRYQKAKTQLRQVKATSQFFSPVPDLRNGEDGSFMDPQGVIRDVAITKFQTAIDSLLRTARSNVPALLDSMKDVILATQSIQKDLSASTQSIVQDVRVVKLGQRMSNTLSNLMTACKNHMSGGSLSPVSLVDAAASHLSSTVIEIAKVCKLRPTSGDLNADFDCLEESNGVVPRQNGANTQASRSTQESEAQYLSPPLIGHRTNERRQGSSFNGKGLTIQIPTTNEAAEDVNQQLRAFLEMQTEGIVSSIQNLLSAIRGDASPQILQTHMGEIVKIVTLVTSSMRDAFATSSSLRDSAGGIVALLESCTSRITDMEASVPRTSEQATKEFKQKLAGIAFDTAKQTKALSLVLHNEVEDEEGGGGEDEVDLT